MTTPTAILRDEHELLLKALEVLRGAADRLEHGGEITDEWWSDMIGWLRGFADRSHHAKEEALLFPAMVERGVPLGGGPVAIMLHEHAEGRAMLLAMEVESPARRALHAAQYIDRLRAHIDKENQFVFPRADAVLDERAQSALVARFRAMEEEQGPGAALAEAADILDALTASFAV